MVGYFFFFFAAFFVAKTLTPFRNILHVSGTLIPRDVLRVEPRVRDR
jgi:hypothetical protein